MRSMRLDVPNGPGEKRAKGGFGIRCVWWILPDGEQLAWPRAKIERLEWHVEVDFVTEVSLLEGHVASSRLTSTRRSRWSKSSVFRLALSCRIGKSGCETCSWRARVKKKRQRTGPGMMRGPVWRGPQAAGKRHSQPFSAKRLPHPRGVCRPTKPVLPQLTNSYLWGKPTPRKKMRSRRTAWLGPCPSKR